MMIVWILLDFGTHTLGVYTTLQQCQQEAQAALYWERRYMPEIEGRYSCQSWKLNTWAGGGTTVDVK